MAQGEPSEALQVIHDTNPLPRITGAVCDHPCVTRCVRNHYDDPLAIRQIKRYAAVHGGELAPPTPTSEHGGTVAVVGAGPAGLATAFRLRLAGYGVTVFDGREGPGGMVRWAIPAFRLTEDDIAADLQRVADAGVRFEYGVRIGEDRTLASLREAHDHVIVTVGAQQGRLMGIPGTVREVHAAGDVVTGPSTVIRAVAGGQRVAEAIRRRSGRFASVAPTRATKAVSDLDLLRRRALKIRPAPLPERGVAERRDFEEVTQVLDGHAARAEASRCLLCNEMCSLCVTVCPNRANHEYAVEPRTVSVPSYRVEGGALRRTAEGSVSVTQRRQIVNLTHLCNDCGNCATFCPTAGAPYRDKPRLHLSHPSYDAETDRALLFEADEDGITLSARVDGEEHRLYAAGDTLRYTCPAAELILDLATYAARDSAARPDAPDGAQVDLRVAVRLHVVLEGLRRSLGSLVLPTELRTR